MKRIHHLFEKTVGQLHNRIEDLLLHQPAPGKPVESDNGFESLSTAKEFREALRHLPEDPLDRSIIMFSRLSPFFDFGVMLAHDQDSWVSVCAFEKGEYFIPPSHSALNLPELSRHQIFRGRAKSLNKTLSFLNVPEDYTPLLLQPRPTLSFLLFSRLADHWLKEHVSEISKCLENSL